MKKCIVIILLVLLCPPAIGMWDIKEGHKGCFAAIVDENGNIKKCCFGVNDHSDSCKYSVVSRLKKAEEKIAELETRIIELEPNEIETGLFWTTPPKKPQLPYLHKNPNNDHWICSKHGDLEPDKQPGILHFSMATVILFDGPLYCYECVKEIVNKLLGQHIKGVER